MFDYNRFRSVAAAREWFGSLSLETTFDYMNNKIFCVIASWARACGATDIHVGGIGAILDGKKYDWIGFYADPMLSWFDIVFSACSSITQTGPLYNTRLIPVAQIVAILNVIYINL